MVKPGRAGGGFERATARRQMIPAQDTRSPDETLLRYAGFEPRAIQVPGAEDEWPWPIEQPAG
jgi:hypothetical protein